MTILIRNARLIGRDGLWSILVGEGVIRRVSRETKGGADTVIDAGGGLVTESHVIPHLHLDKVDTINLVGDAALQHYHAGEMMSAEQAIRAASRVKETYAEDEIIARARRICIMAVENGVTHVRAFADVDKKARLTALRALKKLKKELAGVLTIDVVAFPQEGFSGDAENEEILMKAVEEGADVVGGIPWIEPTREEQRYHVKRVFDAAAQYNIPAAFLSDDTGNPEMRTTEMILNETEQRGWHGRVEICHARALAKYPEEYLKTIINKLKLLDVSIVVNPHTGPVVAPVKKLLENGVNVALGQDDCADAYYPYGRCSMLEVAFLASHLLRMMTARDQQLLYEMITTRAARAIEMKEHKIHEGAQANLILYREKSISELFRYQPKPVLVVKNGEITRSVGVD